MSTVEQMVGRERRLAIDRSAIGRDVLDNIGSGVIFADPQGCIVYANQTAEALLGQTLVGCQVEEVLGGASLCCDDRQQQLTLKRSSGEERLVGYRCVSCKLDDLPGTVISFRDITEIARMRADMDKLRCLSEVGRMCAVVAHEIRNPLAGISATLDSIEHEAVQAGLEAPMSTMREEVDRLGDLLTSFFTFVRHRPPRRGMWDFEELVERSLRAAQPHTQGRQVESHCAVPGQVWLDRDQIQQLLLNLLINAAQATPPGGSISVDARLSADEGQLLLSVSDTGCGIEEDDRERIFDAFYTTKSTGTGLGLSICYRIVSDHGGRIAVDSVLGEGTCVRFELPVRPS